MEWEIVEINKTYGKNVPFVSIGRGKLEFNAAACDLIDDQNKNYSYAQLLKGKEKGKMVVAVKFLTDYENNTIPIKRKQQNGKIIKGMIVPNKDAITALFGKDGSNDGMVRFNVEKLENNKLKIIG